MAPYFLRNLVPRREVRRESMPLITVLASLTWLQWAHFLTGWLAWTCDAIDFFSTSLSVGSLQKQFNVKEASTIVSTLGMHDNDHDLT
jgi:MFS transporter, SHS family, lactate transporter